MSRIGRMPVAIPAGVTVTIAENNNVTVKGPKGTLVRDLPVEMEIKEEDGHIVVTRPNDLKKMKSLHGLTRTLIHNMIQGVTEGYEKKLEVNGVGYRAQKQGKKLTLSLGYSHPVEMEDPEVSRLFLMDRTSSSLRASAKRKSASMQLKSERREDRSRIRAKVSSTLMRLSDAKLVRLVRNNLRRV